MNSGALRQAAEPVFDRAATWLAGLSESVPSGSDPGAAELLLFGIHCALRGVPVASWPQGVFAAAATLADRLAEAWNAGPYEFYSRFTSGGFVSAMMAAAVTTGGESARFMRELCGNAWQAVEARAILRDSPTLLWTGRRLFAAIGGDTAELLAGVWWRSEISTMAAPHLISIAAIRQIVADLAAMSAYGAFDPPLPAPEREYVSDLLPFLAFYYVKERDLELVNLLLRGLRYARLTGTAEFDDAVRFVLSRQRPDGRFTMRDLATHLQARSGELPLGVERTIHLPLTVGSIWALSCSLPGVGALACNAHEGAAA